MNRRLGTVALACCLLGAVLTGGAVGSDKPTIIYPAEEERVVSQGETVEVDVFVDSDGGYGDVGLVNLTMNASFDPEYLRVTGVEPGTYLEGDGQTTVREETALDNEAGLATVTQWRDPPGDGATGNHRFATVTVEVRDDAPATNTTVSFADSRSELAGDYVIPVYEYNATFVVEESAREENESAGDDRSSVDQYGTEFFTIAGGLVTLVVGLAVASRATRSGRG